MDRVLHSSNSNEHYTPDVIIEGVQTFYGGVIDLDPCSNSLEAPNVPALFHYDEALNGLALPWAGKVFVNPPYGRELSLWIQKAIAEYEANRAREILILIPSRTDTQWFKSLNPYSRLYVEGRLWFKSESGDIQSAAPFPSAIFYMGERVKDFKELWGDLGRVELAAVRFDKTAYQREYMRRRRQAKAVLSE